MTKRVRVAAASAMVLTLPLVLSGCAGDNGGGDVATVTATATTAASSTAAQPSPTVGEDAEDVPEIPVAPEDPVVADTPEEIPDPDTTVDGYGTGAASDGPQLGDACIGANIGMRGTAADGTGIICDNYSWQVDNGQAPTDPWVDGQIEWSNCIAEKTVEECRAELN